MIRATHGKELQHLRVERVCVLRICRSDDIATRSCVVRHWAEPHLTQGSVGVLLRGLHIGRDPRQNFALLLLRRSPIGAHLLYGVLHRRFAQLLQLGSVVPRVLCSLRFEFRDALV